MKFYGYNKQMPENGIRIIAYILLNIKQALTLVFLKQCEANYKNIIVTISSISVFTISIYLILLVI